ncbi:uncharacterized protein LOC134183341 [Corticium candelabrum]|uniref:uncharacterized protein LOC134183341 n=1 Tax=Corticium candelabrum TaxID=121492 RepID=UPI002E263B57|nr:uncharacterized protein LOC134183341 [Corticium candelabrum]
MLRKCMSLLFLFFVCWSSSSSTLVAQTPPMGWNSWNHFHCGLNETIIREVADAIASSGLKDAGYTYINLDDCWQINRTSAGVIIPDPSKFPSGLPTLINYVKSKGFKFGLYTDRGLKTCAGRPGAYGHEEIDANTYASWGVEYLKNDDCNIPPGGDADKDYGRMSYYLNKTGKAFVHSVKGSEPIERAYNVSNMRRVGHDIRDNFDSMMSLVEQSHQQGLAKYAHPGFWNDLDMMEIGNGNMTSTEYKAHMSLWCLLKAPLIMGHDPRNMTNDTVMILTNKEVIAINQDPLGVQGTKRASYNVNITTTVGPVVAVQCNASVQSQHWAFNHSTGVIKDVGTGTCLDAGSGHGQVYLKTCDNSVQQMWSFKDDHSVRAKSSSGRCLDVYNFSGPVVQLFSCKSAGGKASNQHFSFLPDGTFRPNISNLCLDVQSLGMIEIWAGPLQNNSYVAVLLNKDTESHDIQLKWSDIGLEVSASYAVRDLWQHKDMGGFKGMLEVSNVESHGVAMFKLTPQSL